MKGARKAWPKGCTATGQEKNGVPLYYDIKPLRNGRIAPGLYTDTECLEEYSANTKTVESVIGNVFANVEASHDNNGEGNDYSNDSLSDSMKRWDSAFDVWTYCHPCKTHDLENTDGSKYADYFGYDDEYYKDDDDDGNNRRLGFEKKPVGDVFECYDDGECRGKCLMSRDILFSIRILTHLRHCSCFVMHSSIHQCQPVHEVLC